MKLGRIKALCKARQMVELFTRRDGRQFLSDGCGVWPVDESLPLNESVVRTIFEVSQKKWEEDWHFQSFDYGEDADAEKSGLMECMLEDFWAEGSEIELRPTREHALIVGKQMQLFSTPDEKKHLWVSMEQFSACPDNVRMYALRTTPDTGRAIAVYDNMFLGGLVRVQGTGEQMRIQEILKELSEKEIM